MSNTTWNTEEEFDAQVLEELKGVYLSGSIIEIELTPRAAYTLISIVQFAARNEEAARNPTFQEGVAIVHELSQVFGNLPAVSEVIRRGWHRDYDVREDPK